MSAEALAPPATPDSFIRRSLGTASTRLLDLPSRYGLHLLIAARLTINDVGAFYIVFAVMTLASGFGRLGIDRALTREVAAALGLDKPQTARRIVRRVYLVTLAQSGAISAVLALLARPIALHILHKPDMTLPLMLGALTILPQNLGQAAAGALAGLNRVALSQMIYQWLWPGLFCMTALAMPLNVTRALLVIAAALCLNATIGTVLMLRVLPVRHPEKTSIVIPPLFHLGLSLFSLELVQLLLSSAPSFVLGIVASTVEVGRYAVAWRIVLALNLLVSAMGAIASPQFARAAAQGDHGLMRKVASNSVGLTLALSGFPVVLLALNPAFFLSRFGPAYVPASPALRVLLIGQFVMILCTTVPELLGMTGHAKSLMRINVVCMAVLLLGLAAFSPHFGAAGAAAATAITMIANAIGVSFAARRDLGIIPLADSYRDARAAIQRALRPATPAEMPLATRIDALTGSAEPGIDNSPML